MLVPSAAVDLDDLQEFLVFRRPTPYWATFAMLHVDDAATGPGLVRDLLPLIRSAARSDRGARDVSVALAVTHPGLAALGVAASDLASFPVQLRDGMAARADLVDDVGASAPLHWDHPFGTGQIHLMVLVTAASEQSWRTAVSDLAGTFGRSGAAVVYRADVAAFPGGRTTFGYRDGISYPAIAGLPPPVVTTPETPLATGEFLLGHPSETGQVLAAPTPRELTHNGTYLGFRKIRTDVAAFRRFLRAHAADAPAQEHLAAKLMGRWPSGAPLALAPDHDDPALAADLHRVNDFGYRDDPRGLACPIGAHVRRVNPRDADLPVLTDPRIHRLLRFGAVYGEPLPDGVLDDDGADRGIYLLFATARPNTFEFIKREWRPGWLRRPRRRDGPDRRTAHRRSRRPVHHPRPSPTPPARRLRPLHHHPRRRVRLPPEHDRVAVAEQLTSLAAFPVVGGQDVNARSANTRSERAHRHALRVYDGRQCNRTTDATTAT